MSIFHTLRLLEQLIVILNPLFIISVATLIIKNLNSFDKRIYNKGHYQQHHNLKIAPFMNVSILILIDIVL